ncbi:TonB family protein [Methylotenera sp. 1P/1]|uniref:TonB family protein n=1 Tax=Methylotenera sp. 1P/1 TaxID=1131551 RepID=UPI0005242A54|nr:TonB family protein [Methylotenera sp. 1P/1]
MHTYHQSFLVTTQDNEDQSLVWALIASMLLHIAIAYVYPQFKSQSILPQRTTIQVQLNQLPEQPTPAATQPPAPPTVEPTVQPEPPKPIPPTPVVQPKKKPQDKRKVLTTTVPTPDQSYQVPVEQQTETPPVTQEETPPVQTSPNTTPATANPTLTQAQTAPTNTVPTTTSTAQQQATTRSSEVATSDEVWDGYGKALAAMVNKLKQYPTIAIRRHLEGEVQVIASFRQGKLVSVELAKASQHQVLNEEAMRTIKKAIEQVALHANLERKTFTVTIPVGFKLE